MRTCILLLSLIPLLAQDQGAPAPVAQPGAAQQDGRYRLETGDSIAIKFLYNPDLNDSVQIRPDGYITAVGGDLLAAGQTVEALRAELHKRYSTIVAAKNAEFLTVQVTNYANRRIIVGGEVQRPGVLTLVGPQTAMGAIYEAGGFLSTAKRGEIVIVRRGPQGTPTATRISMNNKGKSSEAMAMLLQPFDLVLVTESGIAKANRGVDQYIRQMIPGLLTGGFSYLSNAAGVLGTR